MPCDIDLGSDWAWTRQKLTSAFGLLAAVITVLATAIVGSRADALAALLVLVVSLVIFLGLQYFILTPMQMKSERERQVRAWRARYELEDDVRPGVSVVLKLRSNDTLSMMPCSCQVTTPAGEVRTSAPYMQGPLLHPVGTNMQYEAVWRYPTHFDAAKDQPYQRGRYTARFYVRRGIAGEQLHDLPAAEYEWEEQ